MQGLESLNQFQKFVSSLGGLGRFEDTYMIHAAEGETVVPMEVLDRNPVLKKRLFKSMKALGIEPGRYIVGNDLNSLNPVTGQPEFFLKKIFKRIKKGIADVSGYAAPVIGAMYGPAAGALAGAAMGSFKRENPGDPSQWAQMAGLGGLSGLAANIAGGQKMFSGSGLSNTGMSFTDMLKSPFTKEGRGQLADYWDPKGFSGKTKDEAIQKELSQVNETLKASGHAELTQAETRAKILEIIEKDKKGLFGNMSLSQIAKLYGLGTAGLGFLIDRTESDEDVGPPKDVMPEGEAYDWTPELIYANPHLREGGIMDLQGGGESRGPGTGTSDSIPAMLSDGEFVMTADAVRGAGGGDRREGARRMYEAMDRLEARA